MRLTARQRILLVTFCFILFSPFFTQAAGLTPIVPSDCNGAGGCQSICDVAQLAQNILNDAIFIAVFLAAFLFAYAGFRLVASPATGGEARNSAKRLFYNVIVGFVIILASWLIVNAIMSLMATGTAGLPWNRIC